MLAPWWVMVAHWATCLISSLSLFQFQNNLPLSIINYGISKHYAGSQVSDRRPLGYLFLFLNQYICCGYSKEPSSWDGFLSTKNIHLNWWVRKYSSFMLKIVAKIVQWALYSGSNDSNITLRLTRVRGLSVRVPDSRLRDCRLEHHCVVSLSKTH